MPVIYDAGFTQGAIKNPNRRKCVTTNLVLFSNPLPTMFRRPTSTLFSITVFFLASAAQIKGHITPWASGIWQCTDGTEHVCTLLTLLRYKPDMWWCLLRRPMICRLAHCTCEQNWVQTAGGSMAIRYASPTPSPSVSL